MKDLIAKLQMDANCALGAIWMHIDAREKRIAELEAQIAAKPAGTDKLWEAIYQFQHRDSPIIWTDVDAYVYETQIAGGDQSRVRKVFLADQMALQAPVGDGIANDTEAVQAILDGNRLQAPVREVPGYKLVPVAITEAMHVAAVKAIIRSTGNDDCPPNVWRAMLAAAPLPAAPVQQEGE